MSRIFVLHENSAWVEPLRVAFDRFGLPYEEWFLDERTVALDQEPAQGLDVPTFGQLELELRRAESLPDRGESEQSDLHDR